MIRVFYNNFTADIPNNFPNVHILTFTADPVIIPTPKNLNPASNYPQKTPKRNSRMNQSFQITNLDKSQLIHFNRRVNQSKNAT